MLIPAPPRGLTAHTADGCLRELSEYYFGKLELYAAVLGISRDSFDDMLQDIYNIKHITAGALTNKGVPAAATAPLVALVSRIQDIQTIATASDDVVDSAPPYIGVKGTDPLLVFQRRFPTAGTYRISGQAYCLEAGHTAKALIYIGSTLYTSATITGTARQPYSIDIPVEANDTLSVILSAGSAAGTVVLASLNIGAASCELPIRNLLTPTSVSNTQSLKPGQLERTLTGNTWNAAVQAVYGNDRIGSGYGYLRANGRPITTRAGAFMFGLSNSNADGNYTTIKHAMYYDTLSGAGNMAVYESGTNRTNVAGADYGITLSIYVSAAKKVYYYNNYILMYTSMVAATYPLVPDVALYNPAVAICDLELGQFG